tara:strand:+ start:22476 stop:22706 length:231 start_codon:yes stop_codon:yes gene_type:complete
MQRSAPQISGRANVRNRSFTPIVNKIKVTPKLAITSSTGPPFLPIACNTKPENLKAYQRRQTKLLCNQSKTKGKRQ